MTTPKVASLYLSQNPNHHCSAESGFAMGNFGAAIDVCYANAEGQFWVSNSEYASQVLYCPYCGAKAPNQQ